MEFYINKSNKDEKFPDICTLHTFTNLENNSIVKIVMIHMVCCLKLLRNSSFVYLFVLCTFSFTKVKKFLMWTFIHPHKRMKRKFASIIVYISKQASSFQNTRDKIIILTSNTLSTRWNLIFKITFSSQGLTLPCFRTVQRAKHAASVTLDFHLKFSSNWLSSTSTIEWE